MQIRTRTVHRKDLAPAKVAAGGRVWEDVKKKKKDCGKNRKQFISALVTNASIPTPLNKMKETQTLLASNASLCPQPRCESKMYLSPNLEILIQLLIGFMQLKPSSPFIKGALILVAVRGRLYWQWL